MARKQAQQPANKQEENYFVHISNPLEVRRQILESTRKTIYCLQHYHKILLIRNRKMEAIDSLSKSWKELNYLNRKLMDKVPTYNAALLGTQRQEKKTAAPVVIKPEPKAPAEKTDLERLEESLTAIENKLKNLR